MASLRRALASGAFAARALYLDTLGHQLCCAARYPHLQYAILKLGAYLTLLDVVGQNKASPEGTVATFPNVVARALSLFLCSALGHLTSTSPAITIVVADVSFWRRLTGGDSEGTVGRNPTIGVT